MGGWKWEKNNKERKTFSSLPEKYLTQIPYAAGD